MVNTRCPPKNETGKNDYRNQNLRPRDLTRIVGKKTQAGAVFLLCGKAA